MTTDFFSRMFEKERAEQEAYAAAHGYTITERDGGSFYVYSVTSPLPRALCVGRGDAVRVAYALAKVFPKKE